MSETAERETFRFRADGGAAGTRLDDFLAARLGGLSRMRIASLVAAGACAVNGEAARAGRRLDAGDSVEVALEGDRRGAMTPEPIPLAILHEDEDLLVVDKPAGMLVHPTRGVKTGTLANALAHHLNRLRNADFGLRIEEGESTSERLPHAPGAQQIGSEGPRDDSNPRSAFRIPQFVRPGLPHRLDRATSGLMVVAKNQRALSILSRHFHHRLVEKRYLAVVEGRVAEDELEISAPVGRDEAAWPKWRAMEAGRPAETRLRVLGRGARATLVELEPVTGRTNQLRIHCAHVGHPIVGDDWYGSRAESRLCLHAARLAFHHPTGGDWMEFASPLPEEIASLLAGRG